MEHSTLPPVHSSSGHLVGGDSTGLPSEQLLRAFDQNPLAMVVTNLKGEICYANQAMLQMSGYTLPDILGKSTRIFQSGSTPVEVYKSLWSAILEGKVWRNEWLDRKRDGNLYWEEISISPLRDDHGEITHFLGVKQDISLRKRAEQDILGEKVTLEQRVEERNTQLAESNLSLRREIEERLAIEKTLRATTRQLENFFNLTPDLLLITDFSGKVIRLNSAWEKVLGYPIDQLEGEMLLDLVHPDDLASPREKMAEIIKQMEANPDGFISLFYINRYRTRDGRFRYLEWNVAPSGHLFYATARDITERRMAEQIEKELLHLSPNLTGLALSEIDTALQMALERIGLLLDADRAYIFELDPERVTMSNTHEWCSPGTSPEMHNLQQIPSDSLPRWMEALHKQEMITISDVSELPDSWSSEREVLEAQDIKSLLVIPLYIETRLMGFVGLDSVRRSNAFGFSAVSSLKVWGDMLASILNNRVRDSLFEEARQNYVIFYNTIDDFLFVMDSEGLLISANQTLKQRLGYPEDYYTGRPITQFHSPAHKKEVQQSCREILAGTRTSCNMPFVTRKGELIPVETRIKAGRWNGAPAFFGVSKDITQLTLSEEKFAKAFHTGAAMMSISAFETGEYIDVNQTFLDILGYSAEEVMGSTNSRLGIFEQRGVMSDLKEKVNARIPVRRLEVTYYTRKGEPRTGLLSADEIFVGQVRCLLLVTVDISDRKRAEEALKMARVEADKANAAKSEFISRISHELRTPLNSILGFAQLLQMGELTPPQKKGVAHIMRSGKHLLSLINEVLDISRIEAGRLALSIEPVQLKSLIAELLESVTPLASQRNIVPRLVPSEYDNMSVRADKQRLKQVLINLVNNAIKYNREGGELLVYTGLMENEPDGIPYVRISVKDSGQGILPHQLSKLFSPFERIGAEKSQTEGTGLGLSLVKQLVDAMGGHVGVESKYGEGSVFWVAFPRLDTQLFQAQQQVRASGSGFDRSSVSGSILYIEDNLSNVDLVELILRSLRPGVTLRSHAYGKDALPLALELKPNLILLDLNLPDMHGSEVLAQLKKHPEAHNIPVAIITADANPTLARSLLDAGACVYLTKPLEIPDLLRLIDENIKI